MKSNGLIGYTSPQNIKRKNQISMTKQNLPIDNLLNWAVENGTIIHPQIKFESNEEKGVCAIKESTGRISPPREEDSEVIEKIEKDYHLKIPLKIIITPFVSSKFFEEEFPIFHREFNSRIHEFEFSNWNSLTKLYISFYRFNDLTEKCSFQTYIDSLPPGSQTVFPDIPFLWSKNDQKLFFATNLGGNYLQDKLTVLMQEWNEIVSLLISSASKEHILLEGSYINGFQKYVNDSSELLKSCYMESLRIPDIAKYNSKFHWTSFQAYLWAHIIMTSRSFPYRIINQNDEQTQFTGEEGMLVPVLDLLNHNPNEKVIWSSDKNDSHFMYYSNEKFDPIKNGGEIFNNYGLKINEELLLGYGFLLENNEYDSCSLRLASPNFLDTLKKLLINYPMIKLPTFDTYSNTLLNNNDVYKKGILYFISKKDDAREDIAKLFSLFSRNYVDNYLLDDYVKDKVFDDMDLFYGTIRMRLEGINLFIHALQAKADHLLDNKNYTNHSNKDKFSNSQDVIIPDVKSHESVAISYLGLQDETLQTQIKKCNKLVKKLLKDNEKLGLILTYKKIMNRDNDFRNAVRVLFELDQDTYSLKNNRHFYDELFLESFITILWLIRCGNKNYYPEYKKLDGSLDKIIPNYLFEIYLHFKMNYVEFTNRDQLHAESLENYKSLKNILDERYCQIKKTANQGDLAAIDKIFKVGEWKLVNFIIGGELEDKLCFNRIGKRERFLILDEVITF